MSPLLGWLPLSHSQTCLPMLTLLGFPCSASACLPLPAPPSHPASAPEGKIPLLPSAPAHHQHLWSCHPGSDSLPVTHHPPGPSPAVDPELLPQFPRSPFFSHLSYHFLLFPLQLSKEVPPKLCSCSCSPGLWATPHHFTCSPTSSPPLMDGGVSLRLFPLLRQSFERHIGQRPPLSHLSPIALVPSP